MNLSVAWIRGWILRDWNERSCPSWKDLGYRVAFYSVVTHVLLWAGQGRSFAEPIVESLVLEMVSIFAGILVGARVGGWVTGTSWRAWVSGVTRLAGLTMLAPMIDALARSGGAALLAGPWVAPSQIGGWLLGGWTTQGMWSLGLAIALVLGLGIFGWVLRIRTAAPLWRVGVGMVGLWVGAWLLFALPSMSAWTKMSSYGTTFAPPAQVVEQAFTRVWQGSRWTDTTLPRLTTPGTPPTRGAWGMVGLALLVVASLYPRRGWSQGSRGAALRSLAPWVGGGGMVLAFRSGGSWVDLLFSGVWMLGVGYALTQLWLSETVSERDEQGEEPLFGGGFWWVWLGMAAWAHGGLLIIALLALGLWRRTLRLPPAFARAGVIFGGFLGGSLFFAPQTLSALPLLGWAGVALILGFASLWAEEPTPASRLWIVQGWSVGWFLLWLAFLEKTVGMLSIGMIAIGAAGAWLYAVSPIMRQKILAGFVILLGILLHSGVFLP